MENADLTHKKCKPCEGGVSPLSPLEAQEFLKKVSGWLLHDKQIEKKFQFKDFVQALKFVNRVGEIAQAEGHHPDIAIHYNEVTLTLWTHAIGGLSENDFIIAAKVDSLK